MTFEAVLSAKKSASLCITDDASLQLQPHPEGHASWDVNHSFIWFTWPPWPQLWAKN